MVSEDHWERHVRACGTETPQADPRIVAFVVMSIGVVFTSATALLLYSVGAF